MADRQDRQHDLIEHLVHINRVTKVVKGGRRLGFSALVVVGDGKGQVGFGNSKAKEVSDAIAKATNQAKKSMIRVNLKEGRTLHHDVLGRHGSGHVILRSAPPGTGVIAGGPMRPIFESLGIHDVVSKSLGSTNPFNMVRATFDALLNLHTPKFIAAKRGLHVSDMISRRNHGIRNAISNDEVNTDEQSTPMDKTIIDGVVDNNVSS